MQVFSPDDVIHIGMNAFVEGELQHEDNNRSSRFYVYESNGLQPNLEIFCTIESIRGVVQSQGSKKDSGISNFYNLIDAVEDNRMLNIFEIYQSSNKDIMYDLKKLGKVATPKSTTLEGNYIHYEFPNTKGLWIIILKNPSMKDLIIRYRVEIFHTNFRPLSLGKYVVTEVKKTDSHNTFEVYLDTLGDVYTKVNTCYGQLNVSYRHNLHQDYSKV